VSVRRLDLHSHSTASDGTVSPKDLAKIAKLAGLAGLALCDHDTIEGVAEFKKAGTEIGFLAIGGVELSLKFSAITHLLGLDLAGLSDQPPSLSGLQDLRRERNRRLFDRLGELGLDLSWDRVLEISGGGQVGRPHFARAMIEKGYCHTVQDAFDRYLAFGRPAYVPKVRPTPKEALKLLRKAGFAPVLAHPYSLKLPPERWPEILPKWKKDGLLGLEVYHPDHSQADVKFFTEMAKKHDLVITAGSDFHGANKKTPINWVATHSPVGLEVLDLLRAGLSQAVD
jgi:predicted metal-dependent phosphoesterase TrpH